MTLWRLQWRLDPPLVYYVQVEQLIDFVGQVDEGLIVKPLALRLELEAGNAAVQLPLNVSLSR